MDPNRVIGKGNTIPWHYKEDMKWFKEFTMGKTLVMGFRTYESLPIYLSGRSICVLTTKCDLGNILCCKGLKADAVYFRYPPGHQKPWVMDVFEPEDWPDAVVAGGAKTYALLMPYVTSMYVTHLAEEHEGDTYMPEFESQFPHFRIERECKDFHIVNYWK